MHKGGSGTFASGNDLRLLLTNPPPQQQSVLHLWYSSCVRSTTSSFRISTQLRAQLEEAAQRLNRGKNAIIREALEEYLHKINGQRFLEDARKQSMLANAALNEDEEIWLEHADTAGWK
jgi:predicted DNA-binding protein